MVCNRGPFFIAFLAEREFRVDTGPRAHAPLKSTNSIGTKRDGKSVLGPLGLVHQLQPRVHQRFVGRKVNLEINDACIGGSVVPRRLFSPFFSRCPCSHFLGSTLSHRVPRGYHLTGPGLSIRRSMQLDASGSMYYCT